MYRITHHLFLLSVCFTFAPLAKADNVVDTLSNQVHATKTTDSIGASAGQFASQSASIAFSPEGESEALVLKTIDSAMSSIRLAAYSFTLPSVVRALINAKQRGIDVAVLVDYKSNVEETRNGASKHALNLLINASIPTRTISTYTIHHDKYIVVDGRHTQTGSFNYTAAATKRNSENVIVIWNNQQIAKQYLDHWQNRWQQGKDYQPNF